jgi:hypothetical protein
MSRKYKFNDQHQLYFVTFAVVNWIDLFIPPLPQAFFAAASVLACGLHASYQICQ